MPKKDKFLSHSTEGSLATKGYIQNKGHFTVDPPIEFNGIQFIYHLQRRILKMGLSRNGSLDMA